jgi:hypothetical protein
VYAVCFLLAAGIGLFGIQIWRDLMRRLIAGPSAEMSQPELVEVTKP